jgi:hypothetical protein
MVFARTDSTHTHIPICAAEYIPNFGGGKNIKGEKIYSMVTEIFIDIILWCYILSIFMIKNTTQFHLVIMGQERAFYEQS